MASIVVMDDDAGTRMLVSAILRKGGHQVAQADNGADGLALVLKHVPDVVVSDVQMPQMSGFEMVAQLRSNPLIAHIPVILLTSLGDRTNMRTGMTQGADDYIPKPCQADELNEAVSAQLARVQQRTSTMQMQMNATMASKMQEMAQIYDRRLAREQAKTQLKTTAKVTDRSFALASVVYVAMQNIHAFSAALTPEQVSEITRQLYGSAAELVRLSGATHVQFVGEDLMVVYADDGVAVPVNHLGRSAQLGLQMVQAIGRCKQFVAARFAEYGLPPLQIGIALHAGPVALAALPDVLQTGAASIVPVGETITNIVRLREGDVPILWPLMATQAFLHAAPDLLRLGVSEHVTLQGGAELDVYAVLGPGTQLAAD